MTRFLLLLGPSGVGKSEIIRRLNVCDPRFVYISPYMTRALRPGETNKVSIPDAQMDEMETRGEFLVINKIFGIRYATPRAPIERAFEAGHYPMLDWPAHRLDIMTQAFPGRLYVVYVLPPSIEVLRARLAVDARDPDDTRLEAAIAEMVRYETLQGSGRFDMEIVSEEGRLDLVAARIYAGYVGSLY